MLLLSKSTLLFYNIKNKTPSKRVIINKLIKCYMHRSLSTTLGVKVVKPMLGHESSRNYATKVAFRLGKQAIHKSNDDTGKHPHVGTQECVIQDCASKKCPALCDQPTKINVDGHNTHKPPIERMARFVSEKDANGDSNTQYFVSTNKKVEMTEQEKQKYGKDYKPDLKTQIFVNQHPDKYDE